MKTLLYFEIFNYPLKAHEVFTFLPEIGSTEDDVVMCLNALTESKLIFRFGELYSIQPDEKNAFRRIKGNAEANRFVKIAKKKARFIAQFPFVRAVMASGSLSKGYMDKNSDLDFFIVTEPGRLWIARTILTTYKRIFLFNSHKRFCVNYFVDTDHLEIEEKNIFTATELASLIPLYNPECYSALHHSNMWLKGFLPNFQARQLGTTKIKERRTFGKVLEYGLGFFGERLDHFFMRLTLSRWNKMYRKGYTENDFKIAFKTKKYASKNHPKHYQKKILELYKLKLAEYKSLFNRLANDD